MDPLLLRVDGMWCTSCSRAATKVLSDLDDVEDARVGFATGVASLWLRAGANRGAAERAAIDALTALGYPAQRWSPELRPPSEGTRPDDAVRLGIGALLGMWTMVAQLTLYLAPDLSAGTRLLLAEVAAVFATPVVFVVGWRFIQAGWRTLRVGVPGTDLLISLGAVGAWTLSMVQLLRGSSEVWFDSAAMLVVFLLVGRLLESRARARGGDAVRQLMAQVPETAERLGPGGAERVDVGALRLGDRVRVSAGERVPVDGVVLSGRSFVDNRALTGESLPVEVGVGDGVEAAAINGAGPLVVRVEAPVGLRTIDAVARQVRLALEQRDERPSLAERISALLVPVVLVLAALVGAGVWLATGSALQAALRGLTVLVVTCPCALGVAAPLVTSVAVGRAARRGILFRSADALRRAADVDVVALDKTGTLTTGVPEIAGVDAAGDPEALLRWARRAEVGSSHPLARAFLRGADDVEGDGVWEALPGRGVVYEGGGHFVRVGARDFIAPSLPPHATDSEVWVEVDGSVLGRVRFHDPPRPDAPALIDDLRGRYDVLLWSGDQRGPVRRLAGALGLPDEAVAWGCSPTNKAERVRALQAAGRRVAFAGDGLNDSPALATAELGIAVVEATDHARVAAGVVLRDGGLGRVYDALAIAREARTTIRWALIWALTYNAIVLPAAAAGLLLPQWAALAMVGSSLTATLTALRVGGRRGGEKRPGPRRRSSAGGPERPRRTTAPPAVRRLDTGENLTLAACPSRQAAASCTTREHASAAAH